MVVVENDGYGVHPSVGSMEDERAILADCVSVPISIGEGLPVAGHGEVHYGFVVTGHGPVELPSVVVGRRSGVEGRSVDQSGRNGHVHRAADCYGIAFFVDPFRVGYCEGLQTRRREASIIIDGAFGE